MADEPLAWLLDLGRNYGDVSYTRVGATRAFMLNTPELIEETFQGRYRECIKDFAARQLIPLIGHGLLTSDGELWKRQRKLAAPPLTPKRIASYADTMVECTERACTSFRDHEVRDIHVEMMRLTLEIVGKTLLGFDAGPEAERVARVVDAANGFFERQIGTFQGLLPLWVPTPHRAEFRAAVADLDQLIYRIIARCRAQGDAADHLLSRLVHARAEDGAAMSDVQLRDEAVTMLLAGHETTALALTYAVYSLSEQPAIAARVRSELDQELEGRPVTFADLPRLRYLDAVVRETLRLYPPVYAIGREVAKPFTIGGYPLEPGFEVLVSPFVMQRDPKLYDDPERFHPERWLEPRAATLPRFAYFPFGGGPRVCIGNHFALMEIALVLATLLQRLELTVVPGYRLNFSPVVTLRPEHGVPVVVRHLPPAAPQPEHYSVPA
jgi:cytochrome P450